MAIRSRGSYAIKRQRPRYRSTAESEQIIIPYVGPFDALKAAKPAIDSSISGFPSDHRVREVTIEEGGANSGRMVVTLEKPQPGNTGSSDDTQLSDPIYELDWGEERKTIETHPRMPLLKSDRPEYEFPDKAWDSAVNYGWPPGSPPEGKTGRQRTWEDWAAMDGGDVTGGVWTIDQYKALKRQSMDTYSVPFPIARATIFAKFRISPSGAVNKIGSPPSGCGAPNGWAYVKIASRSSKQGRLYTLVEEWRGYPGENWGVVFP